MGFIGENKNVQGYRARKARKKAQTLHPPVIPWRPAKGQSTVWSH